MLVIKKTDLEYFETGDLYQPFVSILYQHFMSFERFIGTPGETRAFDLSIYFIVSSINFYYWSF